MFYRRLSRRLSPACLKRSLDAPASIDRCASGDVRLGHEIDITRDASDRTCIASSRDQAFTDHAAASTLVIIITL